MNEINYELVYQSPEDPIESVRSDKDFTESNCLQPINHLYLNSDF